MKKKKKVKQTGTIEMEKMKTGREMMRMRIKLTRKVLTRMRGVGTKVRTWTMELETRTKATMKKRMGAVEVTRK